MLLVFIETGGFPSAGELEGKVQNVGSGGKVFECLQNLSGLSGNAVLLEDMLDLALGVVFKILKPTKMK